MPFVIVKGEEAIRKHEQGVTERDDDFIPHHPDQAKKDVKKKTKQTYFLSSDREMDEVLNLRIYMTKHTAPSAFVDPEASKEKLVGDKVFYNTDNTDYSALFVLPPKEGKDEGIELLKDIYKEKLNNAVTSTIPELRSFIQEGLERAKMVKAGRSLELGCVERPVEETIEWALSYVNHNENDLADILLSADDQLQEYLNRKARLEQSEGNGNGGPTQDPRLPMNKTGNAWNDEPTRQKYTINSKHIPLSQQLDKLEMERREAFLKAITKSDGKEHDNKAVRDSDRESPSKQNNSSPKKVSESATPVPPMASKKSNHGAGGRAAKLKQREMSKDNISVNSSSNSEISNSEIPNTSNVTTSNGNTTEDSSSKCSAIAEVDGEDSDVISLRAQKIVKEDDSRVPETVAAVISSPTTTKTHKTIRIKSPRHEHKGPIRYSNIKNLRIDETEEQKTATTQANIQNTQRIQQKVEQSMSHIRFEVERRQSEIGELHKLGRKLVTKAEQMGKKMLKHWTAFNDSYLKQRQHLLHMCNDLEFRRPQQIRSKLESFDLNVLRLGQDAQSDMIAFERRSKDCYQMKLMENLSNAKWFVLFISKLKEYTRRTNHAIPLSCYKFLVVIQQLIMQGFTITSEIFYQVLERTITVGEDHRRLVVHKSVKAVRDAVNVTSEQFLKYLEDRHIQPCPELLVQIRANKRKKSRKYRVNNYRRNLKLQAIDEHVQSVSSLAHVTSKQLLMSHHDGDGHSHADSHQDSRASIALVSDVCDDSVNNNLEGNSDWDRSEDEENDL